MAENKAAWIDSPSSNPLDIRGAPKPFAGPGEIVINNAAVSIVGFLRLISRLKMKSN
jgi:hypothetical protein